jgi:hypothetical protein
VQSTIRWAPGTGSERGGGTSWVVVIVRFRCFVNYSILLKKLPFHSPFPIFLFLFSIFRSVYANAHLYLYLYFDL